MNLLSRQGEKVAVELSLNASTQPWPASFSLKSFTVPLEGLIDLAPPEWDVPATSGLCRVDELRGSGSWGDWANWNYALKGNLNIKEWASTGGAYQAQGLDLKVDVSGQGSDWKGTLGGTVSQLDTSFLQSSVRGLRLDRVSFSRQTGKYSFAGSWSAAQAFGADWKGSINLDPEGNYRFQGNAGKVDLQPFFKDLRGTWNGRLDLSGNLFDDSRPAFIVQATSSNARWKDKDFSKRPLQVDLKGSLVGSSQMAPADIQAGWGDAFQVRLSNCEMGEHSMVVRTASLSGDLRVLNEFFPSLAIDQHLSRWIPPQGWKIEGGIQMNFSPAFSCRIDSAEFDSGNGIKGPVSFSYSTQNQQWTFRSPTLRFDLKSLLEEYGVKIPYLNGTVLMNMDLTGRVPSGDSQPWLQNGLINGRVVDAGGQMGSPEAPPGSSPWFSCRNVGGTFEIRFSSQSKRFTTALFARQLIFYTPQPQYNPNYIRTLETPLRLSLTVNQNPGEPYRVSECSLFFGNTAPIRLDIQGTLARHGTVWMPDFQVKAEGDNASVTPIFRGVQIGGTGVMTGTISGNAKGNWIFESDLNCQGVRLELVGVPIILNNIRGVFYFRKVYLDELVSAKNWNRRHHEFPPNPDQPDSLVNAFQQSRNTEPNLQIDLARVGQSQYVNLSVRTILIGETLYLNTLEGLFSQGKYPLSLTGFTFLIPGQGAAWRLRGRTQRVPLSIGVPGMFEAIRFQDEMVDVDFYITRTPPQDVVQTRFISLDFPIGRLKDIPAVGKFIFGWTPDSLNSQLMVVQKVGNNDWTFVNPIQLPDAADIPKLIFLDIPKGVVGQIQEGGKGFIRNFGEGLRNLIPGKSR